LSVARVVFALSKPLHTYIGLIVLLYFILMGLTGILLNHPALLRGFSAPRMLIPAGYEFKAWNRMALREAAFVAGEPDTIFIGGKAGVWESRDAGATFSALTNGFPVAADERDTRCLLHIETDTGPLLLAGTRHGLFGYDRDARKWRKFALPHLADREVVDLVYTGNRIVLFTPLAGYFLDITNGTASLSPVPLAADTAEVPQIPLHRYLLKLHDGSVLGLPGRLFTDGIGLLLIFLSVSGLYIWYFPRRPHRKNTRTKAVRPYRFLYRWHLTTGIWSAVLLLLIALTGIFVRPPFLPLIAGFTVPTSWMHEGGSSAWNSEITRAAYLPVEDTLVLSTRNGFFSGPADFSRAFTPFSVKVPVHGMGVNVLEPLADNRLLIGSFRGLFLWDMAQQSGSNPDGSPMNGRRQARDTAVMAAGAVVRDATLLFWADYTKGIAVAGGHHATLAMPRALTETPQLSLWHFLFEVHNGRIFRGWLGQWTWLIVPTGGILLIIAVLSGTYDWWFRKNTAKKSS